MNDIRKNAHGAGGYVFTLSEKGNTRYGDEKKKAIIKALQDSWTESVGITTNGNIKRQLLNGTCQFLNRKNVFE